MSYWFREVAGWALVLAGLYIFFASYDLLLRRRVIEAAPVAFMGFVVFRGGIHLLKVAVAAKAARAWPLTPAPTAARSRPATRRVGPTPAASILPGPASPQPAGRE